MLSGMVSADSNAQPAPDFAFEKRAIRRGATIVAGVDEVGRGPLAGPVVVAAVILNRRKIPEGLNDSKALTAAARESLYEQIVASAVVSVATAPVSIIAEINIARYAARARARRDAPAGFADGDIAHRPDLTGIEKRAAIGGIAHPVLIEQDLCHALALKARIIAFAVIGPFAAVVAEFDGYRGRDSPKAQSRP